MANTAISGLVPYTTVHTDDLLIVVDVHDTTMASTGTDKKATISQISGTAGAKTGTMMAVSSRNLVM